MICTPGLTAQPITFVKQAKKWIAKEEKNYDVLWNYTDVRNTFHHKLLKMLGFKALRVLQPPPHYLPYYEICRLCGTESPKKKHTNAGSGTEPRQLKGTDS
jgi:hypothetical protein